MDPMQLLFYQAPLSAIMLLIVVPVLEPVGQTFAHNWSLLDIVCFSEFFLVIIRLHESICIIFLYAFFTCRSWWYYQEWLHSS